MMSKVQQLITMDEINAGGIEQLWIDSIVKKLDLTKLLGEITSVRTDNEINVTTIWSRGTPIAIAIRQRNDANYIVLTTVETDASAAVMDENKSTIVIVESPYASDTDRNHKYCIDACADCFRRGEIPFASHLLYPQILDELKPEEREQGITAGYAFWPIAEKIVFYTDFGMSSGMSRAMRRVVAMRKDGWKIEFEMRTIQ